MFKEFLQKCKEKRAIRQWQNSSLGKALSHHQDAALFANAVTSGAVTIDEMVTAARETMVILKENERKLDILLS
jgi:hypothetical protein